MGGNNNKYAKNLFGKKSKIEISSVKYGNEPKSTVEITERATRILDVEQNSGNLPEMVEKCTDLSTQEKIA